MSKEYPRAPKPEPTPIFDEWKRCPECNHIDAELRVEYDDKSAATNQPDMRVVSDQYITVHFYCPGCGHESEHRRTRVELDRLD